MSSADALKRDQICMFASTATTPNLNGGIWKQSQLAVVVAERITSGRGFEIRCGS